MDSEFMMKVSRMIGLTVIGLIVLVFLGWIGPVAWWVPVLLIGLMMIMLIIHIVVAIVVDGRKRG
jgi:hypothetical protein